MAPTKRATSTSSESPAKKAKSGDAKPATNDFFAKRAAPSPPKKIAVAAVGKIVSAEKEKKEKPAKGKGRAKVFDDEEEEAVEEPVVAKEKDVEDAEEEDEDSDEEDEDAEELAEIFTRKAVKEADAPEIVTWKDGESVPYAALTRCFYLCDKTTKRLEISAHLTNLLVEVIEKTPKDLLKTVYLCINRLCPDYEALELGLGETLMIKAIATCTGRKVDQIKADFKKTGDLGEVAQASRSKQPTMFKPKPLTVNAVFDTLKVIAKTTGKDSTSRKIGNIVKLFASSVGTESKFIIRSLEGKLRIGLAEKTVLVSLAHAIVTTEMNTSGKRHSKESMAKLLEVGADTVKAVYSELPSYDLVIPGLLEHGISGIKKICYLTPGIPLKPMLAKPTKAITEVLDRFEGKNFTCEYKYDGERAQVHFLEGGAIKIFSRNSEDMSVKYPDIVSQLPACIKEGTTSFIIDCEAVAWNPEEQRLLPFQELSRRKRKDVKEEDIKVKVHLFAFDLLYLNGKALLGTNLLKRRALLRKHLEPVEGEFAFATSEDATNVEDIQIFLDKSVKEGCEGLMVKMLEGEGSSYEPSRRSIHWLKLKKDYLAGVGDSFDLVVIGGDFGKGKRTNVYGAFHLAIFDADSGTYQSICKIGTGFSDEALQSHYDFLNPLELQVKKGYYDVGSGKGPDVYFEPRMVWEVLAADLSLSPIYTAAKGLCGDRGISLRFPRFIRLRDDKTPEDATGPEQIADAYRSQAVTAPGPKGKKKAAGADDFW